MCIQKTHFQNQFRKNADSGVGPENENVAIVTEVQNHAHHDVDELIHDAGVDNDDSHADINDNDLHPENVQPEFDLRATIVRLIGRLQSKSSMTGRNLTEVIDEFEQVLSSTIGFLKHKVIEFLQNKNVLEEPESEKLLQYFQPENTFEGLKTSKEQINALKAHCNYIDGIEVPLGNRVDNFLDAESITTAPTLVKESYQYVPIIQVLTLIMSNPEVRDSILSERPSEEGFLSSFMDGDYFKQHGFFRQFTHALRIILYIQALISLGYLI